MDAGSIVLIASLLIIAIISVIATTFKSGLVLYSGPSFLGGDHPKFEIDKSKIGKFIALVAIIFLINILYTFLVIRELEAALIYSALNTAFISYGLSYWWLLKEKVKK